MNLVRCSWNQSSIQSEYHSISVDDGKKHKKHKCSLCFLYPFAAKLIALQV